MRFYPFLLAATLLAGIAVSCAREHRLKAELPNSAAPAATPLNPTDRDAQEKMAAMVEQAKSRLRKGEKVTDPNQACMLYFYAALGNDAEILDLLKKNGADIDAPNSLSGETALHLAVLEGTPDAVRRLLDRGARIDTRNQNGKTILYDAVCGGNAEVVRMLLDKGADPNAFELVFGTTPLLAAVEDNQLAIVRMLLEHKADPNAGSHSTGASPLHFAVLRGYPEMVELLLARGADPNVKTKIGRTPLDVARDNQRDEIAEILKKHGGRK